MVCPELGLTNTTDADVAFCTTEGTNQRASEIKLIFEVKMSIVNNYKYDAKVKSNVITHIYRDGSGIISSNRKRRRSAVSNSAIDLSAVFIVPIMNKLEGTIKESPEGNFASNGIPPFERLSGSIRVISSPKTLDILARLISSIIST